jgi:hypothetical protein
VEESVNSGEPASSGPAYDGAELRARMVVCFTAHELRELSAQLGVSVEASGAQDAARALVRHFERERALGTLVEALRRARPLVEWPEPLPEASDPWGAAPSLGASPGTLGVEPELASVPARVEAAPGPTDVAPAPPPTSTEPAFSAQEELDGPVIQDPHVPQAQPWITSGDGVVRPGGAPPSEPPAKPRGIDPRVLVVVAGLTLIAALFAYAAGRASHAGASAAASASAVAPEASAAAPKNPGGPAARAADAFAHGLEDVARTCEVAAAERPGAEVLRAAFERCGPRRAPVQPAVPIPPAEPTPEPTRAEPDRPTRPQSPSPDRPLPPGPSDGGCMKGCASQHASCRNACGPEPTEGSKYADYQACLSKCLTSASKCRLGCQ